MESQGYEVTTDWGSESRKPSYASALQKDEPSFIEASESNDYQDEYFGEEVEDSGESKGTHLKRDIREWRQMGRANESSGMFGDFIEMNFQEMASTGR